MAELAKLTTFAWTRSSMCSSGACIELAAIDDELIGVRDSKDPDGPVLRYTKDELRAFVEGVRRGEFDDLL